MAEPRVRVRPCPVCSGEGRVNAYTMPDDELTQHNKGVGTDIWMGKGAGTHVCTGCGGDGVVEVTEIAGQMSTLRRLNVP